MLKFFTKNRISQEQYEHIIQRLNELSVSIEKMRIEIDALQAVEYYKKHRNEIPLEQDPQVEEAKKVVAYLDMVSVAQLQRKLHVGYARAHRIMDVLEQRGLVGQADGSKPRMVLRKGYDA